MPKAQSKAQQRWWFAAADRGEVSTDQAKAHARGGKSFKRLPGRKRK